MLELLQKLNEIRDVLSELLKTHDYRLSSSIIYAQGPGRFGNIMIRNLACYVLSKKFHCKVIYEKMENIGVNLISTPNTKKSGKEIKLNDADVLNVFQNRLKLKDNHLYHIHRYCQSPEIVGEIIRHILSSQLLVQYRHYIENKYSDLYTNNDIFIHYRNLGKFPTLEWFLNIIDTINRSYNVENIYIAYDKTSSVVKGIFQKYKLIDFSDKSIKETINFGSSRKFVILSHGSFSFTIGLLSYINSKKIYLNTSAGAGWHPQYYDKFCKFDEEKYINVTNM